ncbi:hypothetical protein ACFZ8E_15140 [Methylobacterium sp. HMF5984]|uniref:hypothetical protein n=1 Tax=Methylobacterium sp. HMF5984 TaxID=3367370 RepID=UPI00385459C8
MNGERIPIVAAYRGVEIHAYQLRPRVENVIQPAIDQVFEATDPEALVAYAADPSHPPEARLFAAAGADTIGAPNSARPAGREQARADAAVWAARVA